MKLKNRRLKGPAEVLFVLGACVGFGLMVYFIADLIFGVDLVDWLVGPFMEP